MGQRAAVVVGGGLAGLHAARLLHAAGVDFEVVEARDRLGGRILTADAAGEPARDGFDLGPSWFWPRMQPAAADLVTELGLPTFSQNDAGDVAFERMSREAVYRYPAIEREPESVRLAGGTAALIRALAADLPADRLSLGSRVAAMTLSDDALRLAVTRRDGTETEIRADQVIAALPPRLLEFTVGFAPALDPATASEWREMPTSALAYHDAPLPIGFSKTISQPFVGALIIDLLAIQSGESVLEVGTGLGYQAALLAQLARRVWSVEFVEEFDEAAKLRLQEVGLTNVVIRIGDGSRGWPEHAPFNKILVTAAARQVPDRLVEQLKPGGRIVIPIGPADAQQLPLIRKNPAGQLELREVLPVRFTQLETG